MVGEIFVEPFPKPLEPCEWNMVMQAPVGWRCLILVLGLRRMVGLVATMSLFALHSLM